MAAKNGMGYRSVLAAKNLNQHMFEIEETDSPDTFKIRSKENPEIVFELGAITQEAYDALPDFIKKLADTKGKEKMMIAESLEILEGHLAKTAFAKVVELLKFRLDADFSQEFRETITEDQWKQWALDALKLTNYQPRQTEQTTIA